MSKVALCVIATNRYMEFVNPLLESADIYFLQGYERHNVGDNWLHFSQHDVDYHVFTDKDLEVASWRDIHTHYIEHQPWPMMTLMRYHIMSQVDWSGYDYVYYIDADMRFVAPVGEEIFGDLVAVQHPGYYRGGGDWEVSNTKSRAYLKPEDRKAYYAGGFQGGAAYRSQIHLMAKDIDDDLFFGIIAKWHDESHWNKLLNCTLGPVKVLTPSYCFPDNPAKAREWGISHFEPKILALEKNHKEYRL